jgi:hypothetical protein
MCLNSDVMSTQLTEKHGWRLTAEWPGFSREELASPIHERWFCRVASRSWEGGAGVQRWEEKVGRRPPPPDRAFASFSAFLPFSYPESTGRVKMFPFVSTVSHEECRRSSACDGVRSWVTPEVGSTHYELGVQAGPGLAPLCSEHFH